MGDLSGDERFSRVVERVAPESRLVRAWALKGGISADVTALEIEERDGSVRKVVVRRHAGVNLAQNANITRDEVRLLRILTSAGVAVPEPCYLDESGEIFPTPYAVLEYVEGETEFAPADLDDAIVQMAEQLAKIHEIDSTKADLSFLPNFEDRVTAYLRTEPARLDDSLEEGRIREALQAVWPLPHRNKTVLLHWDYWPGNVLWKDGRIAAIIDWEDARLCDPLGDLGNSRMEMLWAFGVEAMEAFTREYVRITGVDVANLPYWDLCAALRPTFQIQDWAVDPEEERQMRAGHRLFVAQAFERLAG
jgi:aminoglycoside phosphotransferase (APT) family kinase protein